MDKLEKQLRQIDIDYVNDCEAALFMKSELRKFPDKARYDFKTKKIIYENPVEADYAYRELECDEIQKSGDRPESWIKKCAREFALRWQKTHVLIEH